MMISGALLVLLIVGQVAAEKITPDWKLLLDFTATYSIDLSGVLARAEIRASEEDPGNAYDRDSGERGHSPPITSGTDSGTIQADVLGERLRIRSSGATTFSKNLAGRNCRYSYECPGGVCEVPYRHGGSGPLADEGQCYFAPDSPEALLQGADLHGSGEMVFDGPGGFIAMRGKASLTSGNPHPFAEEFCVKVKFPQGLLPPSQAVEQTIQQFEPQAEGALNNAPHADVTINGTNLAIFGGSRDPVLQGETPARVVAIRYNGVPFGVGHDGPGDGGWTPVLKFPAWEQGAGEIKEFACSESASTSASEMLAHPQMAQTLAVFDELIAALRRAQPTSVAFTSFPFRPSLLFKSAAAERAVAPAALAGDVPSQYRSVLVAAGVAGILGAASLLIAMKFASLFPKKREVLLSNMA